MELCREVINPLVTLEDTNEMLIQHILTEEIFTSIFNDAQFHRENNIARDFKVKLKADKDKGVIELDERTSLKGIPAEAWEYKLGNRSALEWVLDQYKEKKPSDPTIAAHFNNYRFAEYKPQVIDLLKRVCTVSVETMKIINQMPAK